MRRVSTIVSLLALAGVLHIGFRSVGPVPPLGALLDPAHGIWAVGRAAELPAEQSLALSGLGAGVTVKYDDRGVPHIFAASEEDASRALGWVHARDRLFQMEVTQRAVAGTLTELVGARALPLDRESRRLALARAAEAKWAAIPEQSEVRKAVTAYMEGVNAYVAHMPAYALPLEYRILGAKPRTFEPKDTYYLLARMSQTLSYQDSELRYAAVEALVGKAAADALFPIDAPIQEPIEPVAGRRASVIRDVYIPAPSAPTSERVAEAKRWRDAADIVATAAGRSSVNGSLIRGEAVIGSNNWAVAPARSASGNALLSGDPHLELTLPSIWYEAHLVVPGVMDVYGVTIPLAPIVPIGFNRDMAWTATNTGNDVVDFYREVVDNADSPRQYQVDGEWRDLVLHVERFRDKTGEEIAEDTMFATHRGPMYQTAQGWLSVRWTARELSDEGDAFRRAARARNVGEWYAAMENYRTPAQNFLTADKSGTIAIRSTGRYPIRPGSGRGDLIFDGSTSASDWTGDRPISWYPQSVAPAQGYLASANQQPMDPSVRPGYLGSDWPSPWRAMRINRLLREHPQMTPDLMRQFHTDPQSEQTPFILDALSASREWAQRGGLWTPEDEQAYQVLAGWDQKFTPDAGPAILYSVLTASISRMLWDELVPMGEDRRVATPSAMMMTRLLADQRSVWWDVVATPGERETRNSVVLAAHRDAWKRSRELFGNDPAAWKWSQARVARVNHLLRLPGFGRDSLAVTSGPGTLSPTDGGSSTHGASWRFVVELGPELRAWGTYPGGQSGNPISSRYVDRLELWRTGQLAELRVPRAAAELSVERTSAVLTFRPE